MDAAQNSQLYLVSAANPDASGFAALLEQALSAAPIAAFLLRSADATALPALAQAARPLCERYGVALVLESTAEQALQSGADGIHMSQVKQVGSARKTLGDSHIVGVFCGHSRDAAMKAGEAGADYIWLDADPELLQWWQEYMLLPCVAQADTPEQAGLLASSGADFVAMSQEIWHHPHRIADTVQAFAAAITQSPSQNHCKNPAPLL